MRPDRCGISRLNSLLLASLLLHLVILVALGSYGREAPPHPRDSSPVLVYLGSEANGQDAARARPRPVAAPVATPVPAAQSRRLVVGVSAAPVIGTSAVGNTSPGGGAEMKKSGASADGAALKAAGTAGSRAASPAAKAFGATAATAASSAVSSAGGAGAISVAATGRSADAKRLAVNNCDRPSSFAPGAAQRRGDYQAQLKSLVEAHKNYPVAARKSGREGSCLRRFVLDRDGALKRVEALSSCGHPFLDAAATRAVTGVGSFPPLPQEYGGVEESFTVTMTFTLTDR